MMIKTMRLLILICMLALGAGCAMKDERTLGTQLDDVSIAASVKKRLVSADPSKIMDINVYSIGGHVYLIGEATPDFQDAALNEARQARGVMGVTSKFFPVGTSNRLSDSALEASINKKLLFADGVKSTQINVDAWGGHVVLVGLMASQRDIDRAEIEVRGVPGVNALTSFLSPAN